VANLSKTLHTNFYQNQSSIVEVMIKNFGAFFMPHSVVIANFVFKKDQLVTMATKVGLGQISMTPLNCLTWKTPYSAQKSCTYI